MISLTSDGRIQRVNRALIGHLPGRAGRARGAFEDLFSREDTAEIRYLMNRARRTGVAATQIEYTPSGAFCIWPSRWRRSDEQRSSGFVLVVEDTSDLLRAQKAAAWNEVARRVAHEIKNPLTPIALCADRIARQLDRVAEQTADTRRILHECSATIAREVESRATRWWTNSRSSPRFPAAQPVPSRSQRSGDNALVRLRWTSGWHRRQRDLAPRSAAGAMWIASSSSAWW